MKKPSLKIQVWKGRDGFRWRMKRNGRIIAESGEGYGRKAKCKRTLLGLLRSIRDDQFEWV